MAEPNTLLNTVKQNAPLLANPNAPQAQQTGLAPTAGEQTEQAQGLMATAQTGKALQPGTGQARLSSIGEKLASMNTLMGAQQVTQQAGLQSMAQEQQGAFAQQQQQGALATISQQRLDMTQDFNNKIKGMMQDQSQNLATLDVSKDKSRVEQMGFMLRLGNEEYINKLQTEGAKARLDSKASFDDALNRTVFADETSMLNNNLQFRSMMGADQRQFNQDLSTIDLDFSLQMAQAENKAASSQMMWSGIGTAAGSLAGSTKVRNYASSTYDAMTAPGDTDASEGGFAGGDTGDAGGGVGDIT